MNCLLKELPNRQVIKRVKQNKNSATHTLPFFNCVSSSMTYMVTDKHTLSFLKTFQYNSPIFNLLWDIFRQNNYRQEESRQDNSRKDHSRQDSSRQDNSGPKF